MLAQNIINFDRFQYLADTRCRLVTNLNQKLDYIFLKSRRNSPKQGIQHFLNFDWLLTVTLDADLMHVKKAAFSRELLQEITAFSIQNFVSNTQKRHLFMKSLDFYVVKRILRRRDQTVSK